MAACELLIKHGHRRAWRGPPVVAEAAELAFVVAIIGG